MAETDFAVFVVDDDEAIRSSLSRALRVLGYRVETFASGAAFLQGWDPAARGVVILDYGMPGMNGLELQLRLNELGSSMPIIFITGHGGIPESVQAIQNGAVDFLEKPFRHAVLVERIDKGFELIRASMAREQQDMSRRTRFDSLTGREAEIVARMLANPSETSSKELAARLGISPRTVDHHRARILEKMAVRSVAELMALAKDHAGELSARGG